jgi:hypothetical protein
MNHLLFTCLLIALLYYFLYHLPKTPNPPPIKLTHSQTTQTDPDPEPLKESTELETTLDQLIKSMTDLTQSLN